MSAPIWSSMRCPCSQHERRLAWSARTTRNLLVAAVATLIVVAVSIAAGRGRANVAVAGTVVARHADVSGNVVALTIDDGPDPASPPGSGHPATASACGRRSSSSASAVEADPGLVRREIAQGCEVGAHTWGHPHMESLSADETRRRGAARRFRGRVGHRPPAALLPSAARQWSRRPRSRRPTRWACAPSCGACASSTRACGPLRRRRSACSISCIPATSSSCTTVAATGAGRRWRSTSCSRGLQERGYRVVTLSELFAEAR